MAEFENEVEDLEDETDNETTDDYSELTVDDYNALQARLKKAESKLVEYKKQAKQAPKETEGEFLTKKDVQLLTFIEKNPEYEGKEDEIKSFLSKNLTLDQAIKLVKPNEEVINRQKTKQASITAGEQGGEQVTYTKDEIAGLSQSEYNRIMDLKEAGKVVIK